MISKLLDLNPIQLSDPIRRSVHPTCFVLIQCSETTDFETTMLLAKHRITDHSFPQTNTFLRSGT